MRVPSYILSTVLLAGLAAAQTAPASQTVSSSPQHSAKPAKTTAKVVAKSPFVPKTKVTAAPAQNSKNHANKPAQAQNGKQRKSAPSQTAAKPRNASEVRAKAVQPKAVQGKAVQAKAVQAKAEPKSVKPTLPKSQQPKKEAAKKQEPKKPEAKSAPVQAKAEAKPVESEKKAATPAPAVVQNEPAKLPSPGKRDPFLNPLVAAGARNPSNCTTGKRCLVIDQIILKGVVQMKNGNLALVENAGKRPYVLHENDSLFNGSVVKITGDSLILREESNDILGRPVTREVVKKVTAPAV